MQAAQTVGGVADDPEEAAGVVEVGVVGVLSPLLRGEAVAEWVPVAEMVEEEVSGVGLERGGAVRAVGDDAFAWVGGERGEQRVVTVSSSGICGGRGSQSCAVEHIRSEVSCW